MTLQVREWLPADAFTAEGVRSVLAEPLAAWSSRWFAQAKVEIGGVRTSGGKSRMAQGLCVQGSATEAELSGRGKRSFLEAALGVELSGLVLTAADHDVLDAFAREAIKDLLARLEDIGNYEVEGPRLTVSLSLAGLEMADVTISSCTLIPAMKKVMGNVRRPGELPSARTEAIRSVEVIVEGMLGRAELTLGDLKGLAVGDVVVLDSLLRNPVELRLPGSGQGIGRGKLTRADNRVAIQF